MSDVWIFGYGSLMWRPDMVFKERRPARIQGWVRRFWQGSHDHRGVPQAPGRVVTLVEAPGESCAGVAYLIERRIADDTFARLDFREKNGYERHRVGLTFDDGSGARGVAYVAARGNHAYLGPAPMDDIVAQVRTAAGPSGSNADYVLALAAALRTLGMDDTHVFELAQRLIVRGQTP